MTLINTKAASNLIQEVVSTYKSVVSKLVFGGPSKISPVVQRAISASNNTPTQELQRYHILVVITVMYLLILLNKTLKSMRTKRYVV